MKLNYDRKSKDPTYFIQKGFRNGTKTTTKNIARIGKHSELLLITDDPLAYAKAQVQKYNEEERKNKKVFLEVKIDFAEKLKANKDPVSHCNCLNVGYFFLQKIYRDLKIKEFFEEITQNTKITFSPNDANRFLTFARILEPDSKLGTYDHLNMYYEKPNLEYVHLLRTMDLLEKHYDEYLSHLFENSNNIVKRNTSVCYYDCTNYYFETESPDEDYVDSVTGEIIKGLRKYGISKQHQPSPLVQMGLFMDSDGIPLSMCITSGSDNEQTTVIPLEKKLLKMLNGKKLIYCADAGLGSFNIRNFNSMGGRAFIVTQSIKKLSKVLQEAVFEDFDYKLLSSGEEISVDELKKFDKEDINNIYLYNDKAYKVINADKAIDLGLYETKVLANGQTRQVKSTALLPQKIIITFSRKMMEYQRNIRNRQIERANKLLKNLDPDTYKKGPNDVTRFIKKVVKGEKTEYKLDETRIENEKKYDGYYAIATNLDDDVRQIIDVSANRYKIEDCFRTMKTNFDARPVFHQKRQRITAHFMVCYTALLIYRLLEKKLENCEQHFTTENIIETLKNMQVANIDDIYYTSVYSDSQISSALNAVFRLGLDRKNYQPKDLNKKIKNILK